MIVDLSPVWRISLLFFTGAYYAEIMTPLLFNKFLTTAVLLVSIGKYLDVIVINIVLLFSIDEPCRPQVLPILDTQRAHVTY